jgi:hypothetical protein
VTFEEEEGLNRIMKHSKYLGGIDGAAVNIKPASEPTDVLWENQGFTKRDIHK